MFRQLSNLKHLGRLRTNAATPRASKPKLLKRHPELEIPNLLEFVVAHHGRPHSEFFFVQIGAFDGRVADPLYQLVHRHHWRGVLVEPQLDMFEQLQRNYAGQSGLQFFQVAIGTRTEEITFYTRKTGGAQVASAKRQLLVKPGHPESDVHAMQLPCWTFQKLLQSSGSPDHVDLLQIDAEGWDYEIIRSIDFALQKPAIIRYEHMVLSEPERNGCLELLAGQGYRFILEDVDTTAVLCESATQNVAA
jgi:FkbM family methyltransferase